MAGTFLIWSSLLAFRLWYPKYNSFSDWNNATDYNYIQKSSCFVLFLLLFGFSHRITVLLGRKRHLEWFCSHHAIFSFTELKKRFLLSFQKITIYYCINRLGGFMVHYSVYSQRANKMRVWLDYLLVFQFIKIRLLLDCMYCFEDMIDILHNIQLSSLQMQEN